MRLFLIPVLALSATSAFAVPPAATHHFTRDGFTYDYAQSRKANGTILLTGRIRETNSDFALRIASNGQVTGTLDEKPVDFSVSKETMEMLAGASLDDARLAAN